MALHDPGEVGAFLDRLTSLVGNGARHLA